MAMRLDISLRPIVFYNTIFMVEKLLLITVMLSDENQAKSIPQSLTMEVKWYSISEGIRGEK